MQRILRVDVCDYNNNVLCNLYDNHTDISGGAVDVYVITERNGWKELTFTIPTKCYNYEGEAEDNFRLDYLKADYRLRTIDDYETDYFLISEPKINHVAGGRNVEVRAGHISQILKNRSIDLEMSEDEGNSVGTAEVLLDVILEGSGWSKGYVFPFMEDDKVTPKQRSMSSSAGQGAFSLIQNLCELFEAKPLYHGDGRTVDILPMNPFSETKAGEVPPEILKEDGPKVIELYYDKNLKNVEKTTNTDTIITRLYAYGSFGNVDTGYCGINVAYHDEYTFTVTGTGWFKFKDKDNVFYYFKLDNSITNHELVWSSLDYVSRSYIYDNTSKTAYRVYKQPESEATFIESEQTSVINMFPFLMDFTYYDEVGLFTDEMLQEVAKYQRMMPEYYQISQETSKALGDGQDKLSEVGESQRGFLKLDISDATIDQRDGDGAIKLIFNRTQKHPDGVIYRSDYLEPERKYFQWYVTSELKPNGDPVESIGSYIYIVHDTEPATWEGAYVKLIYDSTGNVYVDDEGNPKHYNYAKEDDYPSAITVRSSTLSWQPTDKVYLFCVHSMTGRLGQLQVDDETILNTLQQEIKQSTERYPVLFGKEEPTIAQAQAVKTLGWYYKQNDDPAIRGDIYFCWKKYTEDTWKLVPITETEPAYEQNGFYFSLKYKTLFHGENDKWVQLKTENDTTIAGFFAKVMYLCRKRDMVYLGTYEKYTYAIHETLSGWQSGSFVTSSGANYSTSGAIRNQTFITPEVYTRITCSEGYYFLLYAWNNATGEYVGAYKKDGTFNKENKDWMQSTDYKLSTHSEYKYKVALYKKNITTSEGSNCVFSKCLDLPAGNYAIDSGYDVYWAFTTDSDCNEEIYLNKEEMQLYLTEDVASIVKVSVWPYDSVFYPEANDLSVFNPGNINPSTGIEEDSESWKRSNYIRVYEDTTYEYVLPSGCRCFQYDSNHNFLQFDNVGDTGFIDTVANARYVRITTESEITQNHYFRVQGYASKFYYDDKAYIILDNVTGSGELLGINHLTRKFADLADQVYGELLPTKEAAAKAIRNEDALLTDMLGDILRENKWQDANYVEDDEQRLYTDAMDNLKKLARPETTYSFDFLDMYGSNHDEHYYETEGADIEWPDILITDAAHLVDPEIGVNCWAYIDKVNKCYDKPWLTTIEINTSLSLVNQHDFTDVLSRIAEVAQDVKGKQSIYDRSAILGDDYIPGSALEGMISLNQTILDGGASNYHTDNNGNIIFESADGMTAMMLGGRGLGISDTKNGGDWLWRSAFTGNGLTADVITTGYLDANRISAGSITTNKLSSEVGQELEIGSNKALMLYATVNGSRPAGSVLTRSDSMIKIASGTAGSTQSPGYIDILTGGKLNLQGGEINISANSKLDLLSGGEFHLRANGAAIDNNADGVYLGNDGINLGGGKFKVAFSGDTSTVTMKAGSITMGDTITQTTAGNTLADEVYKGQTTTKGAKLEIDAVNGTIDIKSSNTISIAADNNLTLVSKGGDVIIGDAGKPFTIGSDSINAFIYNGRDSLSDVSHDGIYLGTDGINIGKKGGKYVKATADGTVDISGNITSSSGTIGGITIGPTGIYTNDKSSSTSTNTGFFLSSVGAIYLGAYSSETNSCPFQVDDSGNMTANSATIHGSITSGSTITGATISGSTITTGDNFSVNENGVLTATNVNLTGDITATIGKIGNWTISGDNLYAGTTGSYRVQLDASDTLYPLSGLTTPKDKMYAFWCGAANPENAPFSVTKDGIVTIQQLRVKTGAGDDANAYTTVDMSKWLSTDDSDEGYDFNVNTAMGKLKFETIKDWRVNETTGTVSIYITKSNSGGSSSGTQKINFNYAASVKIVDAVWAAIDVGVDKQYFLTVKAQTPDAKIKESKTFFLHEEIDAKNKDYHIAITCNPINFSANLTPSFIIEAARKDVFVKGSWTGDTYTARPMITSTQSAGGKSDSTTVSMTTAPYKTITNGFVLGVYPKGATPTQQNEILLSEEYVLTEDADNKKAKIVATNASGSYDKKAISIIKTYHNGYDLSQGWQSFPAAIPGASDAPNFTIGYSPSWSASSTTQPTQGLTKWFSLDDTAKNYVTLKMGDSQTTVNTTIAKLTHGRYTQGQNETTIGDPTWKYTGDSVPAYNIVTFSTVVSTGATSHSYPLKLYIPQDTDWVNNKKMVYLKEGSVHGTIYAKNEIDASSVYEEGYGSAHLSGTWSKEGSSIINDNKLRIEKVKTGSSYSPLTYIVSAAANINYDSTNNKFIATGKAIVNDIQKGNDATAESDEITINFNPLQSSGESAYRTVSIKNGDTVLRTSSNLTDYGDGYKAVTITSIGLASNMSVLDDSSVRQSIFIQAVASNNAKKDDKQLTLSNPATYDGNKKRCINLQDGSSIIGRVNIDSVYSAGQDAVGVKIVTQRNSQNEVISQSISADTSQSSTKSYSITLDTGSVNSSGIRTVKVNAGSTTLWSKSISDYNDGQESVGINSLILGEHSAGDNWNVTVKLSPTSLGSKDATINLVNVAEHYRAGYTKGTFTQASVNIATNSGSNCYKEMSTGGNLYYKAKSKVTYYNDDGGTYAWYKGDGGYFIVQGEEVNFTMRYYIPHTSGTPTSGTTWYTMSVTEPSSGNYTTVLLAKDKTTKTYYKKGTSGKYARGNPANGVNRGTSVDVYPIDSNSALRLDSTKRTYYTSSTDSTTYYTKS